MKKWLSLMVFGAVATSVMANTQVQPTEQNEQPAQPAISAQDRERLEALHKQLQSEFQALNRTITPTKIIGEQLDFQLPKKMTLAYMTGDPNNYFMAEYIQQGDNLNKWSKYYFAQQRSSLPLEILMELSVRGVKQACPTLRDSITAEVPSKKGEPRRIDWLYFCPEKNAQAPFGEGGRMLFIQGQAFSFKFWQSWRPQTQKQAALRLGAYAKNIQDVNPTICNPQNKQPCKYNYLK